MRAVLKSIHRRRPLKIGVTGGIGSGKSEFCRWFEVEGIPVFYADAVAKDLMDSSAEIQARIDRLFGAMAAGVQVRPDRLMLAEIIFADSGKRQKLNAIVHPHVFRAFDEFVDRNCSNDLTPFLVAEAALIFESGMDKRLDYVIVIDAPEEVCIRRVQLRDGVKRDDVKRRIDSQMPVAKKLARADFIVRNEGTASDLKKVVDFFINLFRSMS